MKRLRKMKVHVNKIFAYFSLVSMLTNTLAPFAAMLPVYAYAEDTGAPVEEVVVENTETDVSEEADTSSAADGQDLTVEEETNENEITEEANVEALEEEGQNQEDLGILPEENEDPEEVAVDPEAPSIIEGGGVSDYNPFNDIDDVVEVSEIPTPVEEPIAEVEETIEEVKEYEFLQDGVEIVNSENDDWSVDGEVAKTVENVKVGVKYIFPLDEDVSVTFTKLPMLDEDRSTLRIERVRVEDLNLPEEFKTDAEYAFDITTDMENGEFEYDLTLPKPEGVEAEVVYIEESIEEVKSGVESEDIKKVEKDKVGQKEGSVEVEGLDHFTTFIVATFNSATNVPSSVKLYQWETKDSGKWITGNLGTSNSDYREGEVVPFQLEIGKVSTANNPYKFSVCRDYEDGDKRGYYQLMTYDLNINPIIVGSIDYSNGPFSGTNVTNIEFNEVGGRGLCASGARETQVYFDVIESTKDTYVYWGGQLASPVDVDVGLGNGSSQYTGASLHMKLLSPNKDLSINPSGIIELATITVTKIVDEGEALPSEWGFTIDPNPNNESEPKYPGVNSDTVVFAGLSTGIYTIEESFVEGYSFYSGSGTNCTFDSNGLATATVSEGVDATNANCIFTNTQQLAEINVVKSSTTTSITFADQVVPYTFTVTNPGNRTLTGVTVTDPMCDKDTLIFVYGDTNADGELQTDETWIYACNHTVTQTEINAGGYLSNTVTADSNESDEDTDSFDIPISQNAKLSIVKTALPTTYSAVGNVIDYSFLVTNSGNVTVVSPFTVTDDKATDESCPATPTSLAPGESITCTASYTITQADLDAGFVTNVASGHGYFNDTPVNSPTDTETVNSIAGKIIIEKQTLPDGETQKFEFTPSWDLTNKYYLIDGQENISNWLVSGTYVVFEQTLGGWDLTDISCSVVNPTTGGQSTYNGNLSLDTVSISLVAGETVKCVFTNTKLGSISGMKFEDVDGDGNYDIPEGDIGLGGWTIKLSGTDMGGQIVSSTAITAGDGSFNFIDLLPGEYTVCENLQLGWIQTWPSNGAHDCGDGTYGHRVVLGAGDVVPNRLIGNFKLGEITACKYVDYTGDGNYQPHEDVALKNINFNLYKSGEGWEYVMSNETGANGCVKFPNLEAGQYKLEEDYTDPDLDGYYPTDGVTEYDDIWIYSGSDETRRFLNAKFRTISGTKFNDLNGNGVQDVGELGLKGWTIYIEGNTNGQFDPGEIYTVTDQDGYYEFTGLVSDSYRVAEHMSLAQINDGWVQTLPEAGYYDIDLHIEITSFDNDFGNVQLTDVHGYKWDDQNGNGYRDCNDGGEFQLYPVQYCEDWAEPLLPGWTINLYEWEGEGYSPVPIKTMVTSSDPAHFGWYWFEGLFPGRYLICEVNQSGWDQTSPTNEMDNCHEIDLPSGEGTCTWNRTDNAVVSDQMCNFGNQYIEPELSIAKWNDSTEPEEIDNEVLFTIRVTAHKNEVKDVYVYDLFSEGFDYVSGSWTAKSNDGRDLKALGITLEPVYASPAAWYLGDLKGDEVVTLTYLARVTEDVEPGIYKDLAWAQGESRYSEVLGYSEPEGYVNDTFVGTEVEVVVDPDPLKTKVDVKEEGEVLGVAILPATGARTIWLNIVATLASIGGLLLLVGGLGIMFKKKEKTIKKGKKVLLGLLTFGFFALFSYKVYAAGTVVRISQPESPASSEFNLVFVAMDIEDRTMQAKCYVQKPGSVSFTTFGSAITIDSGDSGDSRTCLVTESVLSGDGEYKFKVGVVPGSDSEVFSNEVTVDYDGDGPDRPKYIEKEKKSDCKYEIKIKTADDGETSYIKIYRDDDKEIGINDSNKIKTKTIGPDDKYEFTDELYGGDCGKTWYYAVVAFDDAGNASKPRPETITTTTTITEEEEVTEAIVVEGAGGIGGEGLAGEGAEGVEGEEGAEAIDIEFGEGEDGEVLGEETSEAVKTLTRSPWFWIVLAGLGIVIIGAVKKSKKA
ncbi:hypothetical protein K0B04_00735 [Patescibacteria group bacterium]|nr:hypothetical protein [Patescibacteria group bacterium]